MANPLKRRAIRPIIPTTVPYVKVTASICRQIISTVVSSLRTWERLAISCLENLVTSIGNICKEYSMWSPCEGSLPHSIDYKTAHIFAQVRNARAEVRAKISYAGALKNRFFREKPTVLKSTS